VVYAPISPVPCPSSAIEAIRTNPQYEQGISGNHESPHALPQKNSGTRNWQSLSQRCRRPASVLTSHPPARYLHRNARRTSSGTLLFEEVDPAQYDGIIIVGGAGSPSHLWGDEVLAELARYYADGRKMVAAICLSPVVLARPVS